MTNRKLIEQLLVRVSVLEVTVEALEERERAREGVSERVAGLVYPSELTKVAKVDAPKQEKVRGPWIALPNVDMKKDCVDMDGPIAFKRWGDKEVALTGGWADLMRKVVECYAMKEERRAYLLKHRDRHDTMRKVLEVVGDEKYKFSIAFAVDKTEG